MLSQPDGSHQTRGDFQKRLRLGSIRAGNNRRLAHIRIVADLGMQRNVAEQFEAQLLAFLSCA